MISNNFFLRVLFPEEIDRDYSQLVAGCSVLGLFGLLYTVTCRCVCICFWYKWSCRGIISVKWGKRTVTRGEYTNLVDLRGHTPPTCGQKGGSLRPLVRRGPVKPQQRARKRNRKVCVLGKVCGHLASASKLNLGQSGVRAGASRGSVWRIPPFDQKSKGYTPV